MKVKLHVLLWIVHFCLNSLIFYFFVYPVVTGAVDSLEYVQLYFDSLTYHMFVENNQTLEIGDLVYVAGNYLGPYLIISVFQSPVLIFLLNYGIASYGFLLIKKHYRISELHFSLLLLSSPIFFVSLLAVNKEIISFMVFVFIICHIKNKNNIYLLIGILLSILVRWQMMIFVLLWLLV